MKNDDKLFTAFAVIWLLAFLVSIGVTAVVIWAIVRIVLHYT